MVIVVVLAALILSIVIHEVAHGYAALKFGDPTAKYEGRLTLNPIPHIDPFGSIILPLILYTMGAPILAWAKPVRVNFRALRPQRLGMFAVAIAGVAVNFVMAVVAAMLFRVVCSFGPLHSSLLAQFLVYMVFINLLLMLFNLLPIPPLDGSRLWMMWLSEEQQMRVESKALFFIIIIFILLPHLPILSTISPLLKLLLGISVV